MTRSPTSIAATACRAWARLWAISRNPRATRLTPLETKDEPASAERKVTLMGLVLIKNRQASEYKLILPNNHPATQVRLEGSDLAAGGY
jgi:hypothetical protein